MLLAGLDIGSTGCKISVFQLDGKYLGGIYREYPVQRSHSAHEVDARAIWQAVQEAISQASAKYPGIGGIGITSFGESFAMLDEYDEPLMPVMLYTDPRGAVQSDHIKNILGDDRLVEITGLTAHHMYSIPKLMWVKEHCPELYAKTRKILLMQDYIVYMLTGVAQIDYSLVTRTMAFDIRKLDWSQEVLAVVGIDSSLFSKPVPTGTSAGPVRQELREKLGLSPETIIVSVSHDQVAAAIGSGVLDESATVDGAGTVQCTTPVFRSFDGAKMAENTYGIVPFIKEGCYVTYAYSYTGGALVKWFVDNMAGHALQEAKDLGMNIYDYLEGEPATEPTGILVLPHFAGAGTPYMDGGSKGAIVGLTLANTQQEIYRAIMEGVCYEMRLNQKRLAESGVTVAPLHATGGGAKSKVWMQMKADVLNVPVTAMETSEAGAAGSAMLVGIAAGIFRNLEEAAAAMVRPKHTYYPRPEVHEKYEAVFKRYEMLYNAVRPLI